MMDGEDEQGASRDWITERLHELAAADGITLDSVEFLPNTKGFGDILAVRARVKRATEDVSANTLEDLAKDSGEQTQMDARLQRLIARMK